MARLPEGRGPDAARTGARSRHHAFKEPERHAAGCAEYRACREIRRGAFPDGHFRAGYAAEHRGSRGEGREREADACRPTVGRGPAGRSGTGSAGGIRPDGWRTPRSDGGDSAGVCRGQSPDAAGADKAGLRERNGNEVRDRTAAGAAAGVGGAGPQRGGTAPCAGKSRSGTAIRAEQKLRRGLPGAYGQGQVRSEGADDRFPQGDAEGIHFQG